MVPLSVILIRAIHIPLWIIGGISCALFYIGSLPIEEIMGYPIKLVLTTLISYLLLFDLAPTVIFSYLNKRQDSVGYQEKYEPDENLETS